MQSTIQPTAARHPAVQTRTTRTLYAFDACPPERLCRLCRLLQKRGYIGDSTVWVMPHTRRFYLAVEESRPMGLLEEFGVRIAAASMLCCLGEHARCLCAHDAVARLAALDRSEISQKE